MASACETKIEPLSPANMKHPCTAISSSSDGRSRRRCSLYKKKQHPLLFGPIPGARNNYASKYRSRQNTQRSNISDINQRVKSANMLKLKKLESQLAEMKQMIEQLVIENRLLKSVQKRQEGALKKYEGDKGELPKLLKSHQEEIRILTASLKIMKAKLKETTDKLKEKENEVECVKENNSKLKKLVSEKNLLEREELQKKLEECQKVEKEQEMKISTLTRKSLLESKNFKHQLNQEINNHKETTRELNTALDMITKLEGKMCARDRVGLVPCQNKNIQKKIIENCDKPELNQKLHKDEDLINELMTDSTSDILSTFKQEAKISQHVEEKNKRKLKNKPLEKIKDEEEDIIPLKTTDHLSAAKETSKKLAETLEKGFNLGASSRLTNLYSEIKKNVLELDKNMIEDRLTKGRKSATTLEDVKEMLDEETAVIEKQMSILNTNKELVVGKKLEMPKLADVKSIIGDLKQHDSKAVPVKTKRSYQGTIVQKSENKPQTDIGDDVSLSNENSRPKDNLKFNRTETNNFLTNFQNGDEVFKQDSNVLSFKTTSFQSSDEINKFQSEQQKHNLLKALKAIDKGKDSDASTDESDEDWKRNLSRGNDNCKVATKIPTLNLERSKKNLTNDLFGKK